MSRRNGRNGRAADSDPPLTPAAEWQRLRLHGAVTTLASTGRVVRWRPVNMIRMLKDGKIPDELTAYVALVIYENEEDDSIPLKERVIYFNDYLDVVVAASLIEPRVSDDPQGENEIHFDDLLQSEKVEIVRMAREPVEEVRRFRTEQSGNVAVRGAGENVQQSA